MFARRDSEIYELLRDGGQIPPSSLQALADERRQTGLSLADLAVARRLIGRKDLLQGVARQCGC
jgi:hypothetical protein